MNNPIDQRLLSLADLLAGCNSELKRIASEHLAGGQCILDERESWEAIEDYGPVIERALCAIATRLNRAAFAQHIVSATFETL